MLSRIDQISEDGRFTQCLAGLETVQAFHQHETIAIATQQDRCLQADLQNAFGNLLNGLLVERRPALHRNVNIRNRERLPLHHDAGVRVAAARDGRLVGLAIFFWRFSLAIFKLKSPIATCSRLDTWTLLAFAGEVEESVFSAASRVIAVALAGRGDHTPPQQK
jgi:hypothetical protein